MEVRKLLLQISMHNYEFQYTNLNPNIDLYETLALLQVFLKTRMHSECMNAFNALVF